MAEDYGPLPFDIPHRFVTSFIYELPSGPGAASKPRGPVALGAIGDWSVNGILSLNAGRPFTIGTTDRANTGAGRSQPRQLRRRLAARRLRSDQRRLVQHRGVRAAR